MENKKILVTGLVRSGTSWIGKILSLNNSFIHVFEPFHPDHSKIFGDFMITKHFLYEKEKNHKLDKYISDVFYQNYSCLNNITKEKSFRRFKSYVRISANKIQARIFNKMNTLVKDPYAFFLTEYLYSILPELKLVLIIRKPEAFVYSFLRHTSWDRHSICNSLIKQPELLQRFNIDRSYIDDLQIYAQYELNVKKNKQEKISDETIRIRRACLIWNIFANVYKQLMQTHQNKWLFIKYEDIAYDPIKQFEQLYNQLDLNLTKKIKKQIYRYTSAKKTSTSRVVDLKRSSSELIDYWKIKLNKDQIELIQKLTKYECENLY